MLGQFSIHRAVALGIALLPLGVSAADFPLSAQFTVSRYYVENGLVSPYCITIDGALPSVELVRRFPRPPPEAVGKCEESLRLSNYCVNSSGWAQVHVRFGRKDGEVFLQRVEQEWPFAYSCCWVGQ